jgi:hypothetical protein
MLLCMKGFDRMEIDDIDVAIEKPLFN